MSFFVLGQLHNHMGNKDNLHTIGDNLITEILALQVQIGVLEAELACLPNISESGSGTSFSVNPAAQLKNLNDLVDEKLLQLAIVREEVIGSYPTWTRNYK
jgi:hypothetical protein